ncbi:hypothetical protein KEM48_004010 [Puccinia striiformis f. sp. tritici PST-130]|nr:hypothetical protein KEM48_004010 [Puccinia striiformis f. sp. tritici PST-130]
MARRKLVSDTMVPAGAHSAVVVRSTVFFVVAQPGLQRELIRITLVSHTGDPLNQFQPLLAFINRARL